MTLDKHETTMYFVCGAAEEASLRPSTRKTPLDSSTEGFPHRVHRFNTSANHEEDQQLDSVDQDRSIVKIAETHR
jgi:hypothetical protein